MWKKYTMTRTKDVSPSSEWLIQMLILVVTLVAPCRSKPDSSMIPPFGYTSFSTGGGQSMGQGNEPGSNKVDAKGDVIFGGLFPMHEKGTQGQNCGKIKKEKGIQRLEAMLFTVDRINNDPDLLPGLQVGMRILDTCSYDTFALEQCMDFIKAQLSTIDLEDYRCADDQSPAYHRLKPVAGVIGAASSTVSIMVANILRLFKVVLIMISDAGYSFEGDL